MGLPMWTVPFPAETKDANKPDPTATARSAIRRSRRSPAPRRSDTRRVTNHHQISASGTRQRSPRLNRLPAPSTFDEPLPVRDERRAAAILTSTLPPVPESRNYTRDPHGAHERASRERQRMLDELRERSWSDYSSQFRRPSTFLETNAQPRYEFSNSSISHGRDGISSYRYSSNFAPARYAQSRAAEPFAQWSPHVHPVSQPRDRVLGGGAQLYDEPLAYHDTDATDGAAPDFPPLRRTSRRYSPVGRVTSGPHGWDLDESMVDGLGDRQRSFSPDDDHNDAWETMLSTITPDVHLPSADSSFTSAATSASFSASRSAATSDSSSRSNSASSSRTHITVPSVQRSDETFEMQGVCDTSSDEDDYSGSDTEVDDDHNDDIEVQEVVERPEDGFAQARHPDDPMPPPPPARDPYRYSRAARERSREPRSEARRFVDRYYGVSLGRQSDIGAGSGTDTAADDYGDLEDMRGILERMVGNDEIPEEWWMSVGLAPMIERIRGGRPDRRDRERERL